MEALRALRSRNRLDTGTSFTSPAPTSFAQQGGAYIVRPPFIIFEIMVDKTPTTFEDPDAPTLFRLYKDGTTEYRDIYIPSDAVREEHKQFLRLLGRVAIPSPYSMGAVRGKTLLDNVAPHRHHNSFFITDIRHAFASVDPEYLRRQAVYALADQVAGIDMRPVGDFIQQYAFVDGVPGLPLGYPASPALFNLYCYDMDRSLGEICSNRGITYTRWLDDLTFSSPRIPVLSRNVRSQLREVIEEVPGFHVNHRKSRVIPNLKKAPVFITGLALYADGRITPSPKLIDKAAKTLEMIEQRFKDGVMDKDDFEVLSGFNGVLHLAGKPERSGTRVLPRLAARYEDLARQAIAAGLHI